MRREGVLILMPTLFVGGSEKQVRYIAEGLEKSNIPVTLLIENSSADSSENKDYVKKHPSITFVFLNLSSAKEKSIKNKIFATITISLWILKNTAKEKFRWVMFTNLTGLTMVPLCKLLRYKILFNERNPGVKMCNNFFKRKCLRLCDLVVANSISAAKYMSRVLNISVECINNGIKQINYLKLMYDLDSKFEILVPARITTIKNQIIVLKAAQLLKNKMDYHIYFVGNIEDQRYYDMLLKYVSENQLEPYISFLGYIAEIQEYYNKVRLIILSSYEEGTPNVILEAYMNRRMCLASDIIMNRNVILNEQMLFDKENSYELSEKIKQLSRLDQHEYERITDENFKFVIKNYSIERMQQKYRDIFET